MVNNIKNTLKILNWLVWFAGIICLAFFTRELVPEWRSTLTCIVGMLVWTLLMACTQAMIDKIPPTQFKYTLYLGLENRYSNPVPAMAVIAFEDELMRRFSGYSRIQQKGGYEGQTEDSFAYVILCGERRHEDVKKLAQFGRDACEQAEVWVTCERVRMWRI